MKESNISRNWKYAPRVGRLITSYTKTNNDFDFLWFDEHASINEFGNALGGLWNTPRYNDIISRFTNMSNCVSGLVTHTPIYQGGSFQVDGTAAAVVSYACTLKPGANMAQVNAVVQDYNQIVSRLGTHGNFNAFMQVPIISSSGMDVFFFGVYPSTQAYAQGTGVQLASSDYQQG